MPCETSNQWIASGDSQLAAANITGAAKTQARLSLLLLNPFNPNTSPDTSGPLNTNLPYFLTGPDGCPQLFIPAGFIPTAAAAVTATPPPLPPAEQQGTTSAAPAPGNVVTTTLPPPPAPAPAPAPVTLPPQELTTPPATPTPQAAVLLPSGQPCPQGFVSGGGGATPGLPTPTQLSEQLPTLFTVGGGCKPQPVLSVLQPVTPNDFVVVSASSTFTAVGFNTGTVPLTVTVRLADCNGNIQVMQSSLNLTHTVDAGAVQGRICIPLTDGYLLSVVASGAPFCTQPGEVWVQGEVRWQGCGGTPQIPLFSGYLVDQGYLAWPGGPQIAWGQGKGALHGTSLGTAWSPAPSWIPEQGTKVRVSQVGFDLTTSAAAGNRTPILTWFPPVAGSNVYVSNNVGQPPSTHYFWVWAKGINPGSQIGGLDPGGAGTFDAIVHVPIPDDLIGNVDAELTIFVENKVTASDVINRSGVQYEVWTEPAETGF